jgi:hypothetical protein
VLNALSGSLQRGKSGKFHIVQDKVLESTVLQKTNDTGGKKKKKTKSCFVAQAGLELGILQPPPPWC